TTSHPLSIYSLSLHDALPIFSCKIVVEHYLIGKELNTVKEKLKAYRFPLILLASIFIGSIIGLIFGKQASVIKPLGDIFINLLFMFVIPLVFFTFSSSIAHLNSIIRLGKLIGSMMSIFVITGIIAYFFMLGATVIFPLGTGADIPFETPADIEQKELAEQRV